jgi:hypothetical protein
MSKALMQKVDEILDVAEMPDRHSYFQLKNFVVGKEYTVQGQLWQVVRELVARRESYEAIEEQIDDTDDTIKLEEIKKERSLSIETVSNWDLQEKEVLVRKQQRLIRSLYRHKNNLERKKFYLSQEIAYLITAYETLVKVEGLKNFDDLTAQQDYWNEKFSEELNLRLLLNQPIDSEFVRTVMALDDDMAIKKQMTAILQKAQDQMIALREKQRVALSQIHNKLPKE